MQIVRCPSCDGYGWYEDDFTGDVEDCDWCKGVGYVYRDGETDKPISTQDLRNPTISAQLEALDNARMQEMGYTGSAKKPWEQDIRDGTEGGKNPYDEGD